MRALKPAAIPLGFLMAISSETIAQRPVIEEVLVTAQKRSESINDVPLSITALTGEAMSDFGVTDTRDLSKVTPGFTFSKSGVGTPVYTLRGVGFNDQSFFASPTVSAYLDEAPLPYSFMTKGPTLDTERVEVLKGPQGTLFGRNTTGGAINYIANKPGPEFEAILRASYGRFDTSDIEGNVSGPLADTLGARLALRQIRASEGWQKSISRPDDRLGEIDKRSARAILEWSATEDLGFMLTASAWRDKSEPQSPQAIAIIPQNPFTEGAIQSPRVENAELIDPNTDDNRIADWTTELDLKLNDGFHSLSLHTDWQPMENWQVVSITSFADAESDGSIIPAGLDALVSDYEIDANLRSLSQELRLSVADGLGVDWMLGINLARDEGDQHNRAFDRDVSSAFPLFGVAPAFTEVGVKGEMEARQRSAFANIDWYISDIWKLTAGARYNDEKTEFEGCSFDEPTTEGSGLAPAFTAIALSRGSITVIERGECFTLDENGSNEIFQGTLREYNVSGRATLNWIPNDNSLFYFSYARGTKSGGFPVLPASNQSQYEPVTQELLTALELGGKLTLLRGSLQLNAAVFDYDYTDKQLLTRVNDPFFGPLPILRNAPHSNVSGAELSVSWAPLAGLFTSLAGNYIETEIEEFNSLDIDGEPRDFAGRPFNYSPNVQATLLVRYEYPITESLLAAAAIDYGYSDESNATLEGNPLYALDAYGIANARISIGASDQRWKFTLWGRNITSEFQAINVYQIADIVGRYTGMPQSYGATVYYRYDS